jgi:hypothetical protein
MSVQDQTSRHRCPRLKRLCTCVNIIIKSSSSPMWRCRSVDHLAQDLDERQVTAFPAEHMFAIVQFGLRSDASKHHIRVCT